MKIPLLSRSKTTPLLSTTQGLGPSTRQTPAVIVVALVSKWDKQCSVHISLIHTSSVSNTAGDYVEYQFSVRDPPLFFPVRITNISFRVLTD